MTSKKDKALLEIIHQLGEYAYGVQIQKRFAEQFWFGRSYASLYQRLDRLERRGFVASRAVPTLPRHDRPRRLYQLTPLGERVLAEDSLIDDKIYV